MRTVFLGTSDFAVGVLERLVDSAHSPALVLTRPDRPRGRGRRAGSPPVAERARELGLTLSQPESVNSEQALGEIEAARPESVVVCAFGALIKEPLLSSWEMLNVHPSLLPRWRGAAPIERAIMAGDTQTGVCVMRLTAGLDSGPVCLSAAEPIATEDSYGTLAPRLCALGGELLVQALDRIAGGDPPPFLAQDEAGATYAEKIAAEDRLLDPARSAIELERVVRALHPHIGARLMCADGSLLGVQRARALVQAAASPVPGTPAEVVPPPAGTLAEVVPPPAGTLAEVVPPPAGTLDKAASPPPGTLAAVDGELLYGTAEGALRLLTVKPPGGRPMDAAAYLRGHAL